MLKIKEIKKYEVVVLGSGPAGTAAAIAATRAGAKTLLVEQYGFLGGLSVSGLPLLTFHTVSGRQIVRGIAQELVDELKEAGGTCGHLCGSRDAHAGSMTPIHPDEYKAFLDRKMSKEGVDVLLHAKLVDAEVTDGRVTRAFLALKEGLASVEADCFVDATGDADLVAFAGGAFELGRKKDGKTQSMTTLFSIAGIDQETVLAYFPEEIHRGVRPGDTTESLYHVKGNLGRWREAAGDEYPFTDPDHQLWGMVLRDNQLSLNITDIIGKNGTTSNELTEAEQEGRRQIWKIYHFLHKYVPGFEKAFVNHTQVQVGIRETRRIKGVRRIVLSDVLEFRHDEDTIAHVGYSIDMHDPDGEGIKITVQDRHDEYYDIPYGCLVPEKLDGVLVAGRCVSAEHEAHASCRVMVPCMGMGEAAGYAAAIAAQTGCAPRDVNVRIVQRHLKETGAI